MHAFKVIILVLVWISSFACAQPERRGTGLKELAEIETRWTDGVKAAEVALKANDFPYFLLGFNHRPISTLESIMTDLQATEVSDCLQEAKRNFRKSMKHEIESLQVSVEEYEQAKKEEKLYRQHPSMPVSKYKATIHLVAKQNVQSNFAEDSFQLYVQSKQRCSDTSSNANR